MKRRSDGTFLPVAEPLSSKMIGLRISQSRMKKLEEIAALRNLSLAEIARELLHSYIDETDVSSLKAERIKEAV